MESKTWLRVRTICKEVDIDPVLLTAWIRRGEVPTIAWVKRGKLYFVHRERFLQWLENGHVAKDRSRGGKRG